MSHHPRGRRGVTLVAGLVACAVFGAVPVQAQSVPIVVPPVAPVVVGVPPSIPPGIPPAVGGMPGGGRAGIAWSKSGRADVDIDVDRHHGQAAAR
jgi:hypothetical protein